MDYAYENMTFLTEDGEEDLENGKYLSFKKASVAEVSIVDQPANKQTKILSIEKRSLESKLRNIEGVSKALAKKISSDKEVGEMLTYQQNSDWRDANSSSELNVNFNNTEISAIAEKLTLIELENKLLCLNPQSKKS